MTCRFAPLLVFIAVLLTAVPARAQEMGSESVRQALCRIIGEAAAATDVPPAFLGRLIWRESRFEVNVVSRSGAQGVAQFMPTTARARGLTDPFDPEQAIPHAAQLIAELRERFGNLGLAAAAYNGGPARVANWLSGDATLHAETRAYVLGLTGQPVEYWRSKDAQRRAQPLVERTALTTDIPQPCAAEPEQLVAAAALAPDLPVPAPRRRLAPAAVPAQVSLIGAASMGARLEPAPRVVVASIAEPTAEPVAASIAAETPFAGPLGVADAPWGVQLAGNFSKSLALASYARTASLYADILGELRPMIIGTRLAHRGAQEFYRVRIPAESRDAADALCAKLRAAGGACAVLRS